MIPYNHVLRSIFFEAVRLAKEVTGIHQPVNTTHILLAIIGDHQSNGYKMLKDFEIDLDALGRILVLTINELRIYPEKGEQDGSNPLFSRIAIGAVDFAPHLTNSQGTGDDMVTARLVGAFMSFPNSIAGRILNNAGVRLDKIKAYLKIYEG